MSTKVGLVEADEEIIPMWKLVFLQFAEHRLALIGLSILLVFGLVAFTAPWIAKAMSLSPEAQNPLARYAPPMSWSVAESFTRSDRVEKWILQNPELAEQARAALGLTTDEEFLNWSQRDFETLMQDVTRKPVPQPFQKLVKNFRVKHWLGTDELGRDVLMRLFFGARVSMGVGLLVAFAAAVVGLFVGGLAGFYGGSLDHLLMRITDSLLSLPQVPVLIVMAAIDLKKIPVLSQIEEENQSLVKMVIILCLFSWMQVARLVRANVLTLKEREFVLAARTLGGKDRQILIWHLLPNVLAPMLVAVTLGIGNAILFESILSFLGLGIQPPTPSWGNMLFNAQELISEAPVLAVTPGLMILLAIVSFNYVGDGLQDAVDPKAIRR